MNNICVTVRRKSIVVSSYSSIGTGEGDSIPYTIPHDIGGGSGTISEAASISLTVRKKNITVVRI